jgi:hypothetical protein
MVKCALKPSNDPQLPVKASHDTDDDDEHRHSSMTPTMEMSVITDTKVRFGYR